MATQPPAQPESNRGRPQHTTQRGISGGANQDVKTTKRNAMAMGQSIRKRGRQGHSHEVYRRTQQDQTVGTISPRK